MIKDMGGINCTVRFDHILSEREIESREKEHAIKFHRVDGKVQNLSPVYSVIIPMDKFAAVLALPEVVQMDTEIWAIGRIVP